MARNKEKVCRYIGASCSGRLANLGVREAVKPLCELVAKSARLMRQAETKREKSQKMCRCGTLCPKCGKIQKPNEMG